MNFISTRGAAAPLGFVDAMLAGLAPDGGLYAPAAWPRLSPAEITDLAGRPYAQVAAQIFGLFAGDEIPAQILQRLCAEAYAGFDHPAVAPIVQLAPDRFLLELFHGPTLAFKDVAMQILARLYAHVLGGRGEVMTIVCATSGDTGGAAVEAFRGLAPVRVVVLFPEGRISEVQRRFITTAEEANVRCVAVAGDFDDCQAILKSLFQDAAFARAVNLSAVNSINVARIVAQCVYYFTAATALGAPLRPVGFAVPTGNFGDAFAAFAAHLMGLPIRRIIVATNTNDIMARVLISGDYSRGRVTPTMSPAMDIQVASNFERLVFECADRDAALTAAAFQEFAAEGRLALPPAVLERIGRLFGGVAIGEAETAATIATTLRETGVLIDPHTAVAVAAAARAEAASESGPLVVVSTAHPAKFPEAVAGACVAGAPQPAAVAARAAAPERIDHLPASAEAVKRYVLGFAGG